MSSFDIWAENFGQAVNNKIMEIGSIFDEWTRKLRDGEVFGKKSVGDVVASIRDSLPSRSNLENHSPPPDGRKLGASAITMELQKGMYVDSQNISMNKEAGIVGMEGMTPMERSIAMFRDPKLMQSLQSPQNDNKGHEFSIRDINNISAPTFSAQGPKTQGQGLGA